eukprot:symbB.v1.2.032138.t1/scaffold3816.1/size52752/5
MLSRTKLRGLPQLRELNQLVSNGRGKRCTKERKSLIFALMEMKQVTGESDDLFRMCFRLCEYSRQRIEVQGKCQEFLAKLTIMEHLLQRNMMGGLLEFPEIRRGLADALELGPGATLEHVKNCLEKHSAKAPDEVIEDIIKALKVELMVPAPWTRNQSSNGLYFFRIENRDVTSWIWPVQDMLDVIMQNQDVVQDMEDLHYGGMTPPMDIAEDEDHASIATVPTTPAIGPSESPTSVLGTTSAVAPSCVVHPSAAAQRLNPPAFVPSSPSEGEDIEIMGATTPPAPRFQAPRVQKPPEPLEPPSSEGFLSRKPPEPQMPPRYVKEHAAPPAQPSTPPKSGRPKSPARKLPRVLQPQLIPLPPLLPSPLPPPPPPPPPPQEAQHGFLVILVYLQPSFVGGPVSQTRADARARLQRHAASEIEAVQVAEAFLPGITAVVGAAAIASLAQLKRASTAGVITQVRQDESFFGPQRWDGRTFAIALVWVAFLGYSFFLAPGKGPEAQAADQDLLNQILSTPFDGSVSPLFVCIFNMLVIYSATLLPGADRQSPVPAYPLVFASFFLGAFALRESGNLDWFTANLLESRFTGVLLLAGATYLSLFALGNGVIGDVAPSAAWTAFLPIFTSSLTAHVSSVDFMVLWMFFSPVLLEDGRVFVGKPDEWDASDKARFAFCAAVPVFGGLFWLLSRPPLPEQRAERP